MMRWAHSLHSLLSTDIWWCMSKWALPARLTWADIRVRSVSVLLTTTSSSLYSSPSRSPYLPTIRQMSANIVTTPTLPSSTDLAGNAASCLGWSAGLDPRASWTYNSPFVTGQAPQRVFIRNSNTCLWRDLSCNKISAYGLHVSKQREQISTKINRCCSNFYSTSSILPHHIKFPESGKENNTSATLSCQHCSYQTPSVCL